MTPTAATGPAATGRPSPGGAVPNSSSTRPSADRQPIVMLALATLGFAVNFWAWALLSPLGTRYKDLLSLSGSQQALLVAVPVIVGSLGRIPVGALTDRFGGRVMFPLVSVATIVPGPVHRPGRSEVVGNAADWWILPRHRRHCLRGWCSVRERLVPTRAARTGHRCLRGRHGRDRDQRADHGEAGDRAGVVPHRS